MQQFDYHLAGNTKCICCGVNLADEIWENYCCLFWGPKLRFFLTPKRVTHVKGSQKISLHGINLLLCGCRWFPASQQNLGGHIDTDDHKVETDVTRWLI